MTTFNFQGSDLPVWLFDTYEELEQFTDNLLEEHYVVEVKPEYHPAISGVFFKRYPLTPSNATAAYKVKESDWPLEPEED